MPRELLRGSSFGIFYNSNNGKYYLHLICDREDEKGGKRVDYVLQIAGRMTAQMMAEHCELDITIENELPGHCLNVGGMK